MGERKVYRTASRPDGKWQVMADGADRASGVFDTQAVAWERTRELAKNAGLGQAVLQGRDGEIQTEHTYGKDPYPPKG